MNTAALDHLGISVQHVQHVSWLESSALADFKVVEVVTRRDLHRARTKFRIGMLVGDDGDKASGNRQRSEEHTSELQSLMRISYAVFCLKKKKNNRHANHPNVTTKL